MTLKLVSFALLYGFILHHLNQHNHGQVSAFSWTSSLENIWHKVEKGAEEVVNDAERRMNEAKKQANEYLKYGSAMIQIEAAVATGNISKIDKVVTKLFKHLPSEDQEKIIQQIKQFEEKERKDHYLSKFLRGLAEYLEKRQNDETDQPFTDWFLNEIESLLEVELMSDTNPKGYVRNFVEGVMNFIPDLDAWFKKLPSDNQKRAIQNLKYLSDNPEVEHSVIKLFEWIVDRLNKMQNGNDSKTIFGSKNPITN